MPRFPRSSGTACARVHGPSRRQVMVGTAATAAAMPAGSSRDPAVQACKVWQDCQAEYDDLTKRWQTLETYLFRHHNWCKLSRRQRAALPEAAELDAIDDRRDAVFDHKQQLLVALPHVSASTPHGLAAKLTVAASVIHRHENAEGHELVLSVLRDLRNMAGSILE
jgi:hypothetical protein